MKTVRLTGSVTAGSSERHRRTVEAYKALLPKDWPRERLNECAWSEALRQVREGEERGREQTA